MTGAPEPPEPETRRKGRAARPLPFLALILAGALMQTGCGLDQTTQNYVASPSFYNGSGFLVIQDADDATGQDRDYEILYRIYQNQTTASNELTSISSLASSTSSTPELIYNQLKSTLTSALYQGISPNNWLLTLSASAGERGGSFHISASTTTTGPMVVTKIVGSTSAVVSPEIDRNVNGATSASSITQANSLLVSANDYTPDQTVGPSYPPTSAYLVLCVVAEYLDPSSISTGLVAYDYSLPTPLTDGAGNLLLIQIAPYQ